MKLSELFTEGHYLIFTEIALLIFLAVFIAVSVRTMLRPGDQVRRESRLPLEDSQALNPDKIDAPGAERA